MSNCVVRSRGSSLPCSIVADHGIEGGDHLSHDGDDNDFGLLVDRGCSFATLNHAYHALCSGVFQTCVIWQGVRHVRAT